MAIKGDLQDMNLANLMQMLCLDQRKATLVLKRRRVGKGIIFFECGQVVHAEAGSLMGEEAVYHLLSWADGTFEMNDHIPIPHQTITAPWSHLLMEGMRQIDEQRVQDVQPKVVLSPAEIEQDEALENDLILLLSRLEQLQIRLAAQKSQKQPTLALQILTEIINQVTAFSEVLPDAVANSNTLPKILTTVADTYSVARLLRVQHNRLSTEIVSKLYNNWSGDVAERRQTFSEIGQSILHVIETYFSYFIAYFRSSSVAGQWQETCDIFLAELRQEANKIQF